MLALVTFSSSRLNRIKTDRFLPFRLPQSLERLVVHRWLGNSVFNVILLSCHLDQYFVGVVGYQSVNCLDEEYKSENADTTTNKRDGEFTRAKREYCRTTLIDVQNIVLDNGGA